jgi:hypothetical protein
MTASSPAGEPNLPDDDPGGPSVWAVGGIVLVLAGGWCLFGAEIQVRETTDQLRLEVGPAGQCRVVAWFPPAAGGRLRSGQLARLRLVGCHGAPGSVFIATVAEVGTEPALGQLRVDLDVLSKRWVRLPVEHGHSGSVEVDVEQVSPAVLVLRAARHLLSR